MRLALVSLVALALAAAAAAADPSPVLPPGPPANLGPPVFALTGGGYGHGVGLNQYGALGQAQAGRPYREILAFYYPGTELVTASRAKVRILLASGRRSVRVASTVPFRVREAAGATYRLPAGEVVVKPNLRLILDGVPTELAGPLSFLPGAGSPLALDGKQYRGDLRLSAGRAGLQVVNHVHLDAYLRGVVPGEMPREWPLEALKAQAVAARSYALSNLVKGQEWDLYPDVRSQVYYGVEAEWPSTTQAVSETHAEVIAFGGKVATGFYYSSSGGRTASSEDVFGVQFRYLQAREDPWDDVSPYHRWEPRRFTGRQLADAFGLKAAVDDVASVPTASGRPSRLTLVTVTGGAVAYYGADVRTRLALRSTAFRLGVMRISRPPAASLTRAPVMLNGLARDIEAPLLERRVAGGWKPVAVPRVRENGSFAVTVRPVETTRYRLSGSGVVGPSVTVTVAGAVGPA